MMKDERDPKGRIFAGEDSKVERIPLIHNLLALARREPAFSFTSRSKTGYKSRSCRPVALTARASDSKSEGWGFESLLACQENQDLQEHGF